MTEEHAQIVLLALVCVQLQRLIPLLRSFVKIGTLVERIAQHLGVPLDVDVEPSNGVPSPIDDARADTQPSTHTQVGAAPAPPPARSAVR